MATTACHVCSHPLCHSIGFVFQPCNHVACVKCFHQTVPASHTLQCPCANCQAWVTSSTLMELEIDANKDDAGTKSEQSAMEEDGATAGDGSHGGCEKRSIPMKPVQEVIHFEPDEQMDPFRHWSMKHPDLYSGFLYVAFRCNDEEASFYRANFKATNSSVFTDDASSDDLVKIFARVLHPLLFRKDFFEEQSHQRIAPESINLLHSFERQEQQQLALRSLYALSSGKLMSTEEQDEISDSSLTSHDSIKRKAIECAKDLAKEFLLSKKKTRRDIASATEPQTRKIQRSKGEEWRKLLSPIDENKQKLPANRTLHETNDHDEIELHTQIPYMLGFLLLGASWAFSN